jgi:hypothetical protein
MQRSPFSVAYGALIDRLLVRRFPKVLVYSTPMVMP